MKHRILAIVVLASMVACQPTEEEAQPDHLAPGTLSGSAFYFERIAMPDDTSLEIVLINTSGPTSRVLTRTVLEDVGNPPYPFRIDYDPAGVDPSEAHQLWLTLYAPDGSARFGAEALVDLSHTEIPQIRLIALEDMEPETVVEEAVEDAERIDSDSEPETDIEQETVAAPAEAEEPAADEFSELTATQHWQCGDIPVEAIFDQSDALLTLPWTDAVLERAESANGLRFASREMEFRVRGRDQATLAMAGQEDIRCTATGRPSPWAIAREAGVYFRATGNEPGWSLELYDRDDPVLRLELDSGTRELLFDTVIEDPAGDGYFAESPGNEAAIILIRTPCRDTMVGWEFPYRVEMLLNDRELTACGRYL